MLPRLRPRSRQPAVPPMLREAVTAVMIAVEEIVDATATVIETVAVIIVSQITNGIGAVTETDDDAATAADQLPHTRVLTQTKSQATAAMTIAVMAVTVIVTVSATVIVAAEVITTREVVGLALMAFIEPFIYHPLIVFFALRGYFNFVTGKKHTWGKWVRIELYIYIYIFS